MFWKIIFSLYSIGLFCIGWQSVDGGHEDLINMTNLEGFYIIIFFIFLYFIFNILYGLARKIQTLSLTTTIILITITVITHFCLAINPTNFTHVNYLSKPLQYLGFFEIILAIYGIVLMPFYIPLISYLKKYNTIGKKLKNNFFSNFALMWFIAFSLPITLKSCFLYVKADFDINPFIDLLIIVCDVYLLICLYGFIKRKEYIPNKILKITIIPILLFNYIGGSVSNFIETNKEAMNYPIIINILTIFFVIMEILIYYRYIFTNYISDCSDYIEVDVINDNNEKKENKFINEIKSKSKVLKWVYIILIFLFGGLGIHKFYASKIRVGLIYLLLCWTSIPFVISIIEFVYSIFQTPDENGKIAVY